LALGVDKGRSCTPFSADNSGGGGGGNDGGSCAALGSGDSSRLSGLRLSRSGSALHGGGNWDWVHDDGVGRELIGSHVVDLEVGVGPASGHGSSQRIGIGSKESSSHCHVDDVVEGFVEGLSSFGVRIGSSS